MIPLSKISIFYNYSILYHMFYTPVNLKAVKKL